MSVIVPRVLGLDLAAEVSGLASLSGTTTIVAPKVKGKRTLTDDLDRMAHINGVITEWLFNTAPHLVVLEDYAAGIRSAAAHRLAEISGVVRLACHLARTPLALVNVKHVKIYATGKGGATKSEMATSALKRAGLEFPTEDECDAWWLYAMGADHLGRPVVEVPKLHRAALDAVTWPVTRFAS